MNDEILMLLLRDRTTNQNILWGTNNYETLGEGYGEREQLKPELITGEHSDIIKSRVEKSAEVQKQRTTSKAEVFTPSRICNLQINLIDDAWFGRPDVFNTPTETYWTTTEGKIDFGNKSWEEYVTSNRLEITCGEAPYLVSRYDTTTGNSIPLFERIGMFDRKMRIVNENCTDNWLEWSFKALKSIYGYEFQGDNLLLARKNLFYDYIDYYKERFNQELSQELLETLADIITWNLWQMDGLKCVVPYSCHDVVSGDKVKPCAGCKKKDMFKHNGVYCKIYDWNMDKEVLFISLMGGLNEVHGK